MQRSNKLRSLSLIFLSSTFLLAGCDMDNTINKQLEKNEPLETKQQNDEVEKEETLTDNQQEVLENMETQTANDALKENEKELLIEAEKFNVKNEKEFQDLDKFTAYIQEKYFAFHSDKISADEFYHSIDTHLSNEMLQNLPNDEEMKIKTFNELQNLTKNYIKSDVETYQYTIPKYNTQYEYAYSIRKYKLKNDKLLYYKLEMLKEDGKWKIIDDKQTNEYIKTNEEFEFKERATID